VPSFVGMQYTAAQSAAKSAHLELHIVARKPDYHAPKDRIVGQLPAAGGHVREGRIVDVVVSDGEPTTKVPNVANMSVRDATVTLENSRLDVGAVTSQVDADVPEATVLSQTPEALSEVPAGTKVDLVIAKGRPVAYAPNFVGMPIGAAAAAAKDAHVGLTSAVLMPIAPSAPPKGIIVGQDPPAGQQMKPHELIALQVSGGAPPTPVPSPSPSSEEATTQPQTATPIPEATPTNLLSAPSSPRGLRVSVALPQSAQPVRTRVVLLDATGSRTLYDQETRGGFTLSFDLTVSGAGTLETFVGDSLVNSTPL
jgi:serine/threonine-protein kinase